MYLTLHIVKRHLNIEEDHHNEDDYLLHLVKVAEATVEKHICRPLSELEDENGNIPEPVAHAALLYIGDLYQSRESNAYGVSVSKVPFAYEYLLSLYQAYNR